MANAEGYIILGFFLVMAIVVFCLMFWQSRCEKIKKAASAAFFLYPSAAIFRGGDAAELFEFHGEILVVGKSRKNGNLL